MQLSSIRTGMKVYHRDYGITKVVRKSGSRVILENPYAIPRSQVSIDEDDEDEEDWTDESQMEVSVRPDDLILASAMSPALIEANDIKQAKLKADKEAKEKQEAEWMAWKANLPEIPKKVQSHLKGCCKDGMMAFLVFLNTDEDALEKLRQHSLFLLREAVASVADQVPTIEQDLQAKKEFLAMIETSKSKLTKGVKIARTA